MRNLNVKLLLLALFPIAVWAKPGKGPVYTDPEEAAARDPDFLIQGEYASEGLGAQVVALGDGRFQAMLHTGGLPGAGWNGEAATFHQGAREGEAITFEGGARIADGSLTVNGKTLPKVTRTSPTLGAKPPADAVVLFDGSNADAWEKGRLDGDLLMEGTHTKEAFGSFQLHLEFRTPFKPHTKHGRQDRGNSGVYTFNRYETQILDSFGIKPEFNFCGSLYRTKVVDVNMCLPPLTWQTYDITFTAPRFEADKKVANARITVRHNGVLVHDDVELQRGTGAGGGRPEIAEGGIHLQGHGNPVRFRNIWLVQTEKAAADDGAGFEPIFDGKTLEGWDGKPEFWSVQDGAITGITTPEKPTKGNTFCIWRGGEPEDFALRLKFRIGDKGNSGIQFRSVDKGNHVIAGYQADFDANNGWTGTLYEERGRGVLAKRGNKVVIQADGKKETVGATSTQEQILAAIRKGDWNDYEITVKGNHIQQRINGVLTVDVTDHQEAKRSMKGLIALQLHAGPPMKAQFKDILLKRL